MTIRVKMLPHVSEVQNQSNGIARVIEGYFKHLPEFDIELVESDATTYDLVAAHAGITGSECDVCHCHGLYWSGDFPSAEWEWRVNARVIEAIRHAKEWTVPSDWVNETFKRDLRKPAHVIPHGIDWQEWQHKEENRGFVLYAKNRNLDACDNSVLDVLIRRFPDVQFASTLPTIGNEGFINSPMWPKNFRLLAKGTKTPHNEMKQIIQQAGVYLSVAKETFSVTDLEAMASGVPILGWNWGGNSQLIQHGISGYLAEPNNVDDLCEGLNYCLKHRQILGSNGRELAKQWTWAKACEMVAGVYRLAMMEESATVSVVIPVYNKSIEQVKRAIDSCLAQTFKASEIIVVNDGSGDKSSIANLVTMRYELTPEVKYIYQPNQGVANARNNGISHSSSKYIICLDADDWLQPEFIQTCVQEMEKDRTLGIAYSSLRWHNPDGTSGISEWPTAFNADKQLTYAKKQNQVPTACVFRREAWERVGGYKSRYCPYGAGSEDAAFWSAICSIGYNAKKVTDEALFNYSASGGQVHGNREYVEVDWLSMYPWASDGLHPFASVATPKRQSHSVRQYDMPLISVIIPVGPGHETEVANALDSLEMQHFRKWEAVVVWDIAKDIPEQLSKAYPYVKFWKTPALLIHKGGDEFETENKRGAGVARNTGVKIARAPLIFFLDADDVLASPDALQKMIEAWNREQAIVYSDYLGKAVWDEAEAKKAMGENLLGYNTKQHTAVFKKRSANFDCELAQRQPEYQGGNQMPYYHWCLISVLLPKAWHNAIGGFDEDMPTWEDVDYHWRLARAGYCYHRIEEPLVMYNYHKGNRREASAVRDEEGRQKHKSLIQYIKNKYEDLKPVGCNCGGKRNNGATIASSQTVSLSDENFVMIEFDFPGSETRSTYGKSLLSPTKQVGPGGKVLDYRGYARQKGDRFLVHVLDQKARPDMFRPVPAEVVLPETPKAELPEPTLLVTEKKRGRPAKVAV